MKKETLFFVILPELKVNKDYLLHANWGNCAIWPKKRLTGSNIQSVEKEACKLFNENREKQFTLLNDYAFNYNQLENIKSRFPTEITIIEESTYEISTSVKTTHEFS